MLAYYMTGHNFHKKIIISADDFGKSHRANKNILRLAELGKLDRVAVLIHGDFTPDEIKQLVDTGVKMDIHLDLPSGIKFYRNGIFERAALFLYFYLSGRISPRAMQKEWHNQIEKFHAVFGKYPDGVNSHQHIYYFPPYFTIALDLTKKFYIPYIRFGKVSVVKKYNLISLILHGLHSICFSRFSRAKLHSSDFLVSFDWIRNWENFQKKLPAAETEIIFHPEIEKEFEVLKKTDTRINLEPAVSNGFSTKVRREVENLVNTINT